MRGNRNRRYRKGNHAFTWTEVLPTNPGYAWRDGMVSGNGENGYITSGSPYSDTFIFQYMWYNFPSGDPRFIPEELTGQLEEARSHVFALDDQWTIKDERGGRRRRPFYYSYHPGHQLRLSVQRRGSLAAYERWTNYETAETGVAYTDEYGAWERTSFTSRADNATITRLTGSSSGAKLNLVVSIDDIAGMSRAHNGMSEVEGLRYKKQVPDSADYIAQVVHYPSYAGSELAEGGYAGVTRVVTVGGGKQRIKLENTGESMNVGETRNPAVLITDADAVYLISCSGRTHDMGPLDAFAGMDDYALLGRLLGQTDAVMERYADETGGLDYDSAVTAHARLHQAEFNAVELSLAGNDADTDKGLDNESLIRLQQGSPGRINQAFLEQIYHQGRYAMVCTGGSSAPRLCGLWTGEWNPGWRGIYTLDANVNLQVAAMNTGHLTHAPLGYITFFLRNAPDFADNARMAYGMHDALQVSVNSDGDRGMHIEYDNDYPFQYWNAGASWCLLPIFEFWQCNGNRQIPIREEMRLGELQPILSVRDGGLTDEELARLKEKGILDLERDILLPLLTKQANFWEQLCTPEYYTDAEGNACYEQGKSELLPGEKYILIPTYSPENHPIGYSSTITANATMDISAARDGLGMVIAMERTVKREGYETAVAKWEALLALLPDYQHDADGALREWAMSEYEENNDHRHLSHLYVAWPAYETEHDATLAEASAQAIRNRKAYNRSDATAGHGWMHQALVEARLKDGEGVVASLLPMMAGTAYYPSLMTDHDTNRRNHTYCTDTSFGLVAAVHEALVFSHTGVIEILPALPSDWTAGCIRGLLTRTRIEVRSLSWDVERRTAELVIRSGKADNHVLIRAGVPWIGAAVNGRSVQAEGEGRSAHIRCELDDQEEATITFALS
ncbi:glycosyl hydrolase family 95 catalytic domain-containing protein [Paenibacillus sp. 1P07SE]|uniref:glycosyl hydrolase family 95 catalytic domain-containing protein n=1 Tax=Paenibacillus sp. 1P07SE TaxID=3132209 RepID=UPI0039A7146D